MGLFGKTCGTGRLYQSIVAKRLLFAFILNSRFFILDSIHILYEDAHLFAVDKPTGIASVPAKYISESKTIQGMVRRWAERSFSDEKQLNNMATGIASASRGYLNEKGFKPYLLHRLDKNTSGVIMFGKHEKDRKKLEEIFRQKDTKKTYLALVKGVPRFEESTIRIPLDARTANIKVPALTHYKILKKFGPTSLLEVVIETGRKHQIRKHLAMIKNPLVLDPEYGDRMFNNNYQRRLKGKGEFFLRAWKIEFAHPFTKEKILIEAAPEAFEKTTRATFSPYQEEHPKHSSARTRF